MRVKAPFRRMTGPLLELIADIQRKNRNRLIAALLPEVIKEHWWQHLLHYHRMRRLQTTLLVLPLTHFVEKPFQNWTRNSAQLMGSVFVWVDYSFPLQEGRKALGRIIESSPLWDRRFWNLQVTDTSERTMQLRVLATSEDSSKSWDLRCEIREKFIAFIQEHHPRSLPVARAQVVGTQEPVALDRQYARQACEKHATPSPSM